MPDNRYYIDSTIKKNDTVFLEGQEFHHLSCVMRKKQGDIVELVNGKGVLAKAEVISITKKKALLDVTEIYQEKQGAFTVILAQAIPRINRLDFIVEKGCELGMSKLWLFPGERSERKKISENQLERIKRQLIGAMKQSGRLFLPEVSLLPKISHWGRLDYPIYYGDIHPNAPLFSKINKIEKKGLIFVIGPESGLTEAETTFLNHQGALGVKLHKNILRTDTASLVALSLIHQKYFDR